jgi:hypothetical protein
MTADPYPWYTHIWPLNHVFFRGFEFGQESGIRRGRYEMGADDE